MIKVKSNEALVRLFVEAAPNKSVWTFEELIAEVNSKTSYKDPFILTVTLKSLCYGGVLAFDGVKSDKPQNIRYKAPSFGNASSGEDTVPRKSMDAVTAQYKSIIENLKSDHEKQRFGLLKAVEDANQKTTEAQKALSEAQGKERIVKVVVEHRWGPKKAAQEKEHVGTFHSKFERLLTLAKARQEIFIYGPTGSGKSFIGKQMADVLELPFYFVSCSQGTSEAALVGRLLPGQGGNFEYWESEFVKAYENGGVFLIDEIDAADANVLLVINTALANGRFAVPRREKPYAERHPDFVCIAAANTLGTGSSRMYSGRSKLDVSTLSRFGIGKVLINYDDNVEKTLCPDEALRAHLLQYRRKITENRLERAMDSRFMEKAFKMHSEHGFSFGDIDEAFFLGWPEDEVNKVKGSR